MYVCTYTRKTGIPFLLFFGASHGRQSKDRKQASIRCQDPPKTGQEVAETHRQEEHRRLRLDIWNALSVVARREDTTVSVIINNLYEEFLTKLDTHQMTIESFELDHEPPQSLLQLRSGCVGMEYIQPCYRLEDTPKRQDGEARDNRGESRQTD